MINRDITARMRDVDVVIRLPRTFPLQHIKSGRCGKYNARIQ